MLTFIKKRWYLLLGVFFLIVMLLFVLTLGKTYVCSWNIASYSHDLSDYHFEQESLTSKGRVEFIDSKIEGDMLTLRVRGVSRGRVAVAVLCGEEYVLNLVFHVHTGGVVTFDFFFGYFTGWKIIPLLILAYLAILLVYLFRQCRRDVRENLFQYKNIRNVGWILFLVALSMGQVFLLFSHNYTGDIMLEILNHASVAVTVIFPVAFVVSILVTISNINLMRKEGRNWRNMLGVILGLMIMAGTLFPPVLAEILQRSSVVDVHNEKGWALYVERAVENMVLVTVLYLECFLISTIILSVRAARHMPSFDKDYMLILGCQIQKDGSLTKLLQGRVDRALEFARRQEAAGGKKLVFVPSGGKGSDEVISEAEAMHRYLLRQGISDDRILVEGQSSSTEENFKNSLALIHEREEAPKVAFSTTNYYVFRSGILATEQGAIVEGIGSKTRSYFWINAFVREFVATLYSERRNHIKVILFMDLVAIAFVVLGYFSVAL